jgi:hypothetical protein
MTANFREYANFIWGVADLIRDSFKRGKFEDVSFPLQSSESAFCEEAIRAYLIQDN